MRLKVKNILRSLLKENWDEWRMKSNDWKMKWLQYGKRKVIRKCVLKCYLKFCAIVLSSLTNQTLIFFFCIVKAFFSFPTFTYIVFWTMKSIQHCHLNEMMGYYIYFPTIHLPNSHWATMCRVPYWLSIVWY